jgi:succinyl-diaminopimelate desuccinylase
VATEQDGKLYGRGAYDMKAAATVLANVFCEFVDTTPYPLALQIVSDEEDNGHNGTDYQIAHGVRGTFVICGDCGRTSSTYTIANEAKGNVILSVMFKGKAAHGAYPWHGDNAALKAADFVRKLHTTQPPPKRQGKQRLQLRQYLVRTMRRIKFPIEQSQQLTHDTRRATQISQIRSAFSST